jgi:tetratricopeptide (TPR) repeat protein
VLRRDFSFELVQSASAIPAGAALDGLDELLARGILLELPGDRAGPARYDFAHALVRDRVYESLSGARRQYLHRQIAGRLESVEVAEPERLAYHYTRGGVRDRACLWSIRAGLAAMDVYAAEDAIQRFRSALELAVERVEEHAARAGIGDALVLLGRPQAAIEAFEAALASAPDVEARAELYRRVGRAYERQGSFDLALEAYSRARQSLRGRPPTIAAAKVADGLATVYVRLGRADEAIALCEDALAWLDKHPEVDDADQAESWLRNTLCMALVHAADFSEAVAHLERSLELKRQLGDRLGEATLRNNLGVVFYRQGLDETARDHYAASLAIKEDIGDGYGRAIALTNVALMETHLGDHATAARHLAEAERVAGDVHATWLVPEIRRVAAQRFLAVGDTDAALDAARGALAAAEELGVPAFIGVAHRVLGLVKAAAADPAASEEHFQTSLAVFEMLGDEHESAKTHAAFAEALAAHGESEAAAAHRRAAREVFERSGAAGRLARLEGTRRE